MGLVTNASFAPASSSLASVFFRCVAAGYRDGIRALTSVESAPWGTYVIEHRGGQGPRTVDMTVYFNGTTTAAGSSDFRTFRTYPGKKGTLLWPLEASTTGELATLESCEMQGTVSAAAVAASLSFTVGTT